jgi:hypothetical protein
MKSRYLTVLAVIFCSFSGAYDALALTVSPVRVEVTGNPGQTLTGEMEILNEQADTKTFYSSFENFEPSGDTGSPKFVGNTGNLSTWMKTNERIDITPGEKIIIPYTITIPQDAEPGGYFSAIFWGQQNPATQAAGEVSIGGKLGVLVLLRVAGDIHEEAGISEFTATDGKRIFLNLPVGLSYRFTNKGQDRVVPLGDITIKNTFGFTVATIAANQSEGNVLPNSTRKFNITWGDVSKDQTHSFFAAAKNQFSNFHFGYYKATVSVVWGSENKVETATTWFVLFPWQLLSVVLVLSIVLFFAVRRYNAWIISRNSSTK